MKERHLVLISLIKNQIRIFFNQRSLTIHIAEVNFMGKEGGNPVKEYMTSFGIPIVCRIEGGNSIKDVQDSLAKRLKNLKLRDYPSLELAVEQDLTDGILKSEALNIGSIS